MAPRDDDRDDETPIDSTHELDDRLADATMWAWYGPAFGLAFKHWPVSLGVGVSAVAIDWLLAAMLPWSFGFRWWEQAVLGYLQMVTYSLVVTGGYRFLVQRENVGAVNGWPAMVLRVVQIQTIWFAAAGVVIGAFALLTRALGPIAPPTNVYEMMAVGRLSLIIAVVMFLLMPVWFSLGVATVLSDVFAVRSSENAWRAVQASLRLAFDQKWRVFWSSYLLVILAVVVLIVVSIVASVIAIFMPTIMWVPLTLLALVAPTALAVSMTFVIERAYAPHITMPGGEEAGAELPDRPQPGSVPPPRVRPQSTPAAPLPSAPKEIADRIVEDLRGNRLQLLVEAVEQGLKADPRFFVGQADETLAVAKRLGAVKRADLALAIVQPYLKYQRGHRQHLTVALYAANLLLRDLGRKADAARFLAQVKTLYPNEPMVDQLIKITDKTIAEGAGAA